MMSNDSPAASCLLTTTVGQQLLGAALHFHTMHFLFVGFARIKFMNVFSLFGDN